jgi:hypothetical protein
MTTYTIAYGQVLYACAPDGDKEKLELELQEAEKQARIELNRDGLILVSGLILTNDRPDNERRIVWQGHDLGWLTDENGNSYEYAIRASEI